MYKKIKYNALSADNSNVLFRIHKGFSLAELMIVMLILALILAATMPILSKRAKVKAAASASGGSSLWQKINASSDDIYYGASPANNNRVAIGTNTFGITDARLVLNTTGLSQNQMVFKEAGNEYGRLVVDSKKNMSLSNFTPETTTGGNTALGYSSTTSTSGQSTALGYMAVAKGLKSTAVGYNNRAQGSGSVAIGASADAAKDYAIAIGGYAGGIKSVSISGYVDSNTSYAVSIGAGAGADYTSGIGFATGSGSVAIGAYSLAQGLAATAIGGWDDALASVNHYNSAISNGKYSIAIGYNARTYGDGSVAIGTDSSGVGAYGTANNEIRLGNANHTTIISGKLKVGTLTTGGATLYQNGGVLSSSDAKLKKINGESKEGLDKIKQLKVYNYTFKKDKKKEPRVGVVAQDLQKVFPNAVKKGEDGYLFIRQEDMFYAMINSIKQLDKMIQNMVSDVKSLALRIQKVEEKMVAMVKSTELENKKIQQLETENKQLKNKNAEFEKRLRKLEKTLK